MGILRVQNTGFALGSVASPQNFAYGSNVTAGNWLGIVIALGLAADPTSVTDSLSQTWSKAKGQIQTTDVGDISLWYKENTAGGANTVTMNWAGGGANVRAILLEYSGLATSGSLDQTNSGQADASSTVAAGNVTTTQNDELIIVAARNDTTVTFTAGSGYTIRTEVLAAPNTRLVYEDQITSSTGTFGGNMTASGNMLWAAIIATIKGTGGGGGGTAVVAPSTLTLMGVQ